MPIRIEKKKRKINSFYWFLSNMICNLQKYATSSWFPVDFLSKWRRFPQLKFTFDYKYDGIISVMRRDSSKKTNKNMEKISLLCFESCCDIFGIEEEKEAPTRTRSYSYTWINYWFGLLLLLDYYVSVLMKIGPREVWKNTRKMAILVFLDLESELCLDQKYFFSWKWRRKKLSKSAICPVLQHGGFDSRIKSCHG